jgi:hypothetical protein
MTQKEDKHFKRISQVAATICNVCSTSGATYLRKWSSADVCPCPRRDTDRNYRLIEIPSVAICMYLCMYVCICDVPIYVHMPVFMHAGLCTLHVWHQCSVLFCSVLYNTITVRSVIFVVQFTVPPRNARRSSVLVPEHWRLRWAERSGMAFPRDKCLQRSAQLQTITVRFTLSWEFPDNLLRVFRASFLSTIYFSLWLRRNTVGL